LRKMTPKTKTLIFFSLSSFVSPLSFCLLPSWHKRRNKERKARKDDWRDECVWFGVWYSVEDLEEGKGREAERRKRKRERLNERKG